jgi:hypothetical protein
VAHFRPAARRRREPTLPKERSGGRGRKLAGVPEPHAACSADSASHATRVRPGRGTPGRGRRLGTAAVGALLLAALTGGCAKFDAALGQQWATVNFKPDTSVATLLKVRAVCSHVPNVRPEALPAKQTVASMMYALTYRTDHASDANLAQLQQCLQKFPQVAGIDFEDSGNAG